MKNQGYCVKCEAKKEMVGAVESLLKNGRKAIKGKCRTCGMGMFKMLGESQGTSSKPARRTVKTETAQKESECSFAWTFFH